MGWPATSSRATIGIAFAVALVAVACYDIRPPPVPGAERVPTIVGQIVGGTPGVTYELSTGDTVEIRDAAGAKIREQLGSDGGDPPGNNGPEGGLILAGEDAAGKFYAATRSPDTEGCFPIFAPGYLQQDRVLLSTGLVLKLAADVRVQNDRTSIDRSWLFSSDVICLDRSGEVTSIHQVAMGA